MVFNSSVFAIFLVIVFAIYWGPLKKYHRVQNISIIIASYFFYGWWDWRFLFLLLFSSLIDFFMAWYMGKTENRSRRKFLLGISLVTNLGLLSVFKYYDFFVSSLINGLAQFGIHPQIGLLHVVLPVGISFYTFQSLSYTIDVYRKKLDPVGDIITFSAFVSFFPQLVAGPIERATHMLPQFNAPRKFDFHFATSGLRLMLWGFFKKIVIADNAMNYSDRVFNAPADFHGFPVMLGSLAFAVQIYCDFSGYSDIARGCARLFGFDIMVNFNRPYFSTSAREFWHRWHISLSTWFRDYLYIPLGGNRFGFNRTQLNLLITFLISGLWHGAKWTFVVWGLWHGIALCLQNVFQKYHIRISVNKYTDGVLFFLFVTVGWIFFRSNTLSDSFLLFKNLFHPSSSAEWEWFLGSGTPNSDFLLSFILFITLEIALWNRKITDWFHQSRPAIRWAFYYGIIVWILLFGALNQAPHFIYFQF